MKRIFAISTMLLAGSFAGAQEGVNQTEDLIKKGEHDSGKREPEPTRNCLDTMTIALTVTIFGATTQFVIAWLIGVTGSPLAPAIYVMVLCLVSIAAMAMLRETKM